MVPTTMRRVLVVCALLPTLGLAVLGVTRDEPDAEAPPLQRPLAFWVIVERFKKLERGATRAEVERLLGPTRELLVGGPEIMRFEESWSNGGKAPLADDRVWYRWSDPKDNRRWVAVMFMGRYQEQTVFFKLDNGL